MKAPVKWMRIAWLFGVLALIIGVIDPLEGSVLIVIGSIVLAVTAYIRTDPHWKVFMISSLLIITGVSFMFYLSSLGGIGGDNDKSLWWGALIIPYPAGWLLAIIMLIIRAIRKR